jgi:hypothetical protein
MLMGSRGTVAWVETAQGIAAIVAAVFPTMVAWWNPGLPRLVFSPQQAPVPAGPSSAGGRQLLLLVPVRPDNRLQYDNAGTLGNGTWGYIVGTYDKDAAPDNQRLYLNGTRVAQMSDTLPLDLNSNPLGIGRRVSGIADP